MLNEKMTRRLLMSGTVTGAGVGIGVGASMLGGASAEAQDGGFEGPGRTEAATLSGGPNSHGLFYRDLDERGRSVSLQTLLDREHFISAHRFFSEDEIADATGYRGKLDHTRSLQAALDAAWSTNRDVFLPAGLYRVRGLRLPGGEAERNRAFRFYGQGSGELFARAESGGTIIKAIDGGSVLHNRQDKPNTGNGNQEIAYIRFEGDSDAPVVDLATLFGQSEVHHCGIYQAGTGDGLRVRMAATGEIHHNYILNRDWPGQRGKGRRTGTGLAISNTIDCGLVAIRKNTCRGFAWGYTLGRGGDGVMVTPRIEHCEVSVCESGILLASNVHGAVVEQCYWEGGQGGTALRDEGRSNTLSNNYVYPGFARGFHIAAQASWSRITNNMISAGNARSVAPDGCTMLAIEGRTNGMVVTGNAFVCDPDSFGGMRNVIGIASDKPVAGAQFWPNSFAPQAPWEWGDGSRQTAIEGIASGIMSGEGPGPRIAGASLALERFAVERIEGGVLQVGEASWIDYTGRNLATLRGLEAERDGAVIIITDRGGRLTVESSARIRLADGARFSGPGTLTLLTIVEGSRTEAVELSRTRY